MTPLMQTIIALVLAITIAALSISTWRSPNTAGDPDRMTLLSNCTFAIALLSFARVQLWWSTIPIAFWFVGAATVAAGVLGAVLRWPDSPWLRARKQKRRLVDSTMTILFSIVVTVVLSQA